MLALVKTAPLPGHVELIETPAPVPRGGEVLVKVGACGICGTDFSLYHTPERLAAEMGMAFPLIFGHEFAGWVSQTGSGVDSLQVGDLVTVNPVLYCGRCFYCNSGREEICESRPALGAQLPGGFAEYVAVREENALRLPPSVPPAVGALGEPLAVALHAVKRSGIMPGWRTVIVGAGPLGLLTALACKLAGAEDVVVVGLRDDAERLAVARQLGLEASFADDAELDGRVRERTLGLGAEVTFEVAGTAPALHHALRLCRKDGTVVTLGIPHEDIPVDISAFTFAEKRMVGSRGYTPRDWADAVSLIATRTDDLARIVSDVLPLESIELAISRLASRKGLKVVLDPSLPSTSRGNS
jgi:threonine dehydrogenase-like Zn-dependent dehydrogenase